MQRACILREIAQDTDKFRQAMHFGSLEDIPSSRIPSLSFNLPAIPDIQPQLIEVGLPRHLARALYLSYCDKASRHRLRTLRQMNRLADLPGMSSDNAIRTLATIFSKQLEEWRDQAISCVHTRSSPTQLICKRMRTSFDPKYTPLLKNYFKYNAYPSASEKRTIAMWTGMSPRQIEVWFQNNRNRHKHDQLLVRSSKPPPLEDIIHSLVSCPTPKCTEVAFKYPSQLPACLPIRSPTANDINPLNPAAPMIAFPIQFPLHCDYESFSKEASQCRMLPWPRTPPYTLHQASLDKNFLEELSEKFSLRLNLHRGSRKRSYDAVDSAEPFRYPFYTYLHRGRRPAFVTNDPGQKRLHSLPDITCRSNQSSRPAKRPRSSNSHAQRSRSIPVSSISSCPSSNTLPIPTESPIPVLRDFLEADTNPVFSPPHSHPLGFKPFAGPLIKFGLPTSKIQVT